MHKLKTIRIASAALLATTALASPAFADAPAPRFLNIDANGVDLTTGKVQFAFEEGGIGTSEGAVRFQRIFAEDAGWVDNFSGGMFDATVSGVTKTYVQIAGISDVFTNSGGIYTADNAAGSTLVYDNGTGLYNYTAADGTKISFSYADEYSYNYSCPGSNPKTCHVPLSITKPNGLKVQFTWEQGVLCYNLPGEPCVTEKDYQRLTGLSTSAGFSASITYVSNSIGNWPTPNANWFNRSSITFTNSANPPSPQPSISYGYPSSGVVTVTDPGSRQWRLTTDASNRIIGIRRPGSASDNITYAYGADGTISSATKDGVTTTYARSVSGSTATETTTDALSNHTVTTSDLTITRPTSFQDELSRTTGYLYDPNGRLTKVTQPEGNYTQLTLDARGNFTTTTNVAKSGSGLANIVTSASFDATCTNVVKCNKPNSTTDAKGNVTDYTYDGTHGGPLTVTRPAPTTGAVRPQTRYSYSQITSASGDLVYELTGVSACQTTSSCTGGTDETKVTAAYNSNLLSTTVTRANGTGTLSATTAVTYDARGRVDTIDGPLSGTADTTKYRWDSADQLAGVTSPDPDGAGALKDRAMRLTYRSDGQVSKKELGTVNSQSDSDWALFSTLQTVDITFDSNSRPITSKLSASSTDYALTQTSYDALGRVDCAAVRMNTAIYGSLPTSACTLGTQGSFGPDRISQNVYDAASEVTQLKIAVGTTDAATERTLTYTSNGKLASLKDSENNLTTYVYDGFDRLLQTQYPSATKGSGTSNPSDYEQLSYDANSNVTQYRARSGGTISFSYDNLDRRSSKNSSALADVNYTYDLLDRPLTVKFATGGLGVTNTFDALSRLTTSSSDVGGAAHSLSYQYDLAGRRTQMNWWDGFYVNYDRLVTGETSKVRENGATSGVGVLATYGYDDLRRRTSTTLGNGASQAFGYDAVSRLASLTNDLSGTANDLSVTFSYNPAGQMTQTVRTGDIYAWTGHGNGSTAFTQNGLNQQVSIGGGAATWDANGNLIFEPQSGKTYAYDLENKLTSSSGGTSTSLAYDPLDRLDTYNPGALRRFIYDGGEAVAELDSAGAIQNRYVRGDGADELLIDYSGSGISSRRFVGADERGSVISLTDSAGALININHYDEYGKSQSTNVGRFQYTGQAWLSEASVYHYKIRAYLPHLGIFAQTDPIGDANLYSYGRIDPVNWSDPTGLYTEPNTGCLSPNPDCGVGSNGYGTQPGSSIFLPDIRRSSSPIHTGPSGFGPASPTSGPLPNSFTDSGSILVTADLRRDSSIGATGNPLGAIFVLAGLPGTSVRAAPDVSRGFFLVGHGQVETEIFSKGITFGVSPKARVLRIETLTLAWAGDNGRYTPVGSIEVATYECYGCKPTWDWDVPVVPFPTTYRIPSGNNFLTVYPTESTPSPTAFRIYARQ